ncbi:MAG: thioredoxin [Patescibacteria group bacterium]
MAKAVEIGAKDFEAQVLESDVPVLVDFWAPWCMPCQMMAPVLDEVAGEPGIAGKAKIVKLNVEEKENQDLAHKYKIMSIPNMKIFKGGEVAKEIIGVRPKDDIVAELKSVIDN